MYICPTMDERVLRELPFPTYLSNILAQHAQLNSNNVNSNDEHGGIPDDFMDAFEDQSIADIFGGDGDNGYLNGETQDYVENYGDINISEPGEVLPDLHDIIESNIVDDRNDDDFESNNSAQRESQSQLMPNGEISDDFQMIDDLFEENEDLDDEILQLSQLP